ncbi:MAG TPA: RNA polymerase subunit sigma [Verrucomicrobiales bacterium]|nr:RNA polymerase subunit sigma [Verrucomicrobiales bacterium]
MEPPQPASSARTVLVDDAPVLDPERWVDEHGDCLFHFALSRLRDPVLAEDFVQEALLAALRSRHRFEGRSSERSWLTGILKNKILDHFRKAGRETVFTDLEFYREEEAQAFDNTAFPDHWNAATAPSEWTGAGAALNQEEFWQVFHRCSGKLPERVARVFLLREVDHISSDEICATLNITPSNLWVMLHRARLALRRCLEVNWFEAQSPTSDEA